MEVMFVLNEWFPGCELHHLDEHIGIYVPASLNRFPHSLKKRKRMVEVNEKIAEWFDKNENPRVDGDFRQKERLALLRGQPHTRRVEVTVSPQTAPSPSSSGST